MASEFTFYSKFKEYLFNGNIDLEVDTIKLALVTSDYIPDAAHEILADVLSSPSPEVVAIASPSNGYTAGGKTLTGQAVTSTSSPSQSKFDAGDVTWTALTATFRYGILYAEKSVGSPAIVNPIIGYILFDTTPADVIISGIDYLVQWSANGVFTLA